MSTHLIVAVLFVYATAAAAAQSSPKATPGQASASNAPSKPLTLVGCVTSDRTAGDRVTLSDTKSGVIYRLRGLNVGVYSGRRVRIVGGLYPSPNVAAQAGAIDPTKYAMAAAAATGANITGTGTGEPVEFHIAQVRPLTGACPPR